MITTPDIIGHIGYAIIFCGTRQLHKKNKWGWALRVTGDIIWTALGVYMGYTSIMIWSFMFALNDARGWYLWNERTKQKEKRARSSEVRSQINL